MNSTHISTESKSAFLGLVALIRPKQWIKNGFVLAPLIFSGQFVHLASVKDALLAVFLFCIASSATYILNDYQDIEHDRQHPIKRYKRPLASGCVTKSQALVLLISLYGVLIAFAFLAPMLMLVIFAYLLLNLAYSFFLKHQPVIDIFTIALGFVLRVFSGAVALSVPVSSWMFVTTLCLALYLASIKRRQELLQRGQHSRKVLSQYSVVLVDRYAEISATGALLFYSLFVMTARPELVITIPFVLYGLFRYWFVVEVLENGESPTEALVNDWQLIVTVVFWVATCIWVLWP